MKKPAFRQIQPRRRRVDFYHQLSKRPLTRSFSERGALSHIRTVVVLVHVDREDSLSEVHESLLVLVALIYLH